MPATYQQLLSNAQRNYQSVMRGYQTTQRQQQQAQQQIAQGYNQLSANVLGTLAGSAQGRSQEIADTYAQRVGAANQDLINRGLGNTTVASAVGRGFALDEQKAQNLLAGQTAGLTAQYQSQLGLAGLDFRNQANRQNTAFASQRLGYQGDHFRNILNAEMQGAAMDQQRELSQMRGYGYGGGGGRGFAGGSITSEPLGSWSERMHNQALATNLYAQQLADDPYVNLSQIAGMYSQPQPAAPQSRPANPWQYAPDYEMENQVPGYTYQAY